MSEGYQNLRGRKPLRQTTGSEGSKNSKPDTVAANPSPPENDLVGVENSENTRSTLNLGNQDPQPVSEPVETNPPVTGSLEFSGPSTSGPLQQLPAAPLQKVEIVAELSANHKQDLDLAFQTLRAMAEAGVDAVKLQSYDAQSLTLPLHQPPFIIEGGTPWDGRSLFSLYEEAAMPWAWHKPLYKLAAQLGVGIFSTPFCLRGVDYLEQLGTLRYKIASFEIGHLELVRRVAATGKPIIVSLGIAEFRDIELFLEACAKEGNSQVTLLQCTSAYPASPAQANLAMLPHLKSTFGCRVGLSDHGMGWTVAVAAVALGAELIEKHCILSREIGGPDASFSMEPAEFAAMVREVRIAEAAVGRVDYSLNEQKRTSQRFGRAIFVLRDLNQGAVLQRDDLAVLRPFPLGAIEPQYLESAVGAQLCCDVSYGTALEWHMLEKGKGRIGVTR